jgi:hypothetical protein
MKAQSFLVCLSSTVLFALSLRLPVIAADWSPQSYATEDTLEMLTVGPEEGAHWFPVWLVVINDQVYVRLGSRAATRIEKNTTAPYVGVKVAGQQFDRIKTEAAPDMAGAVAKAIADKYWSDIFVRFFPHPLTLRLVLE